MLTYGSRLDESLAVDRTNEQNYPMIPGCYYSTAYSFSGILSGDETNVLNTMMNRVVYPDPNNHPEYNNRCSVVYAEVDSATGRAIVQWYVIPEPYGTGITVAPIIIAVIVVAIAAVLSLILLNFLVSGIKDLGNSPAGQALNYVTIAIVVGAAAALVLAVAVAVKMARSDSSLTQAMGVPQWAMERRPRFW